jgi:hypothetical protein
MARTPRPPRARVREATQPPEFDDTDDIGNFTAEGTANIDPQKLLALKEKLLHSKLSQQDWSKVKFVARNAPFNRRSQIPPA